MVNKVRSYMKPLL